MRTRRLRGRAGPSPRCDSPVVPGLGQVEPRNIASLEVSNGLGALMPAEHRLHPFGASWKPRHTLFLFHPLPARATATYPCECENPRFLRSEEEPDACRPWA